MSERLHLAEHFVGSNGLAAARTLEELPADVAGVLIDAISDPVSLTALKSMLPFHAAKCITAISDTAGSKYLAALSTRDAAAILRHTEENSRKNLIDLLPRQQAVRVSLILGYSQSLLGAWMDPLSLSLPISSSVADAKKRIANEGYDHNIIFAVDDGNKIRGVISLVRLLLRANDADALSALMERGPRGLPASMTLERAFNAKEWAESDTLPVIDRNDRFIGVMRYAELRSAMTKPSLVDRTASGSDNLLGITEACYLGLADLMATTLADDHGATADE